MAVDDILTLRIVGRYQDQNIVNTIHYRITAQVSSEKTICIALLTSWTADLQAEWLSLHTDTYELIGLKCFRKTGDPKTPAFTSIGVSGGVATPGLPAFVCRTITLYTDSANHRRRGRVMLSGTPADTLDVADGSLTAAAITAMEDLVLLLIAPLDGVQDAFQCCIPPTDVLPFEDITDAKARETPSSVTNRRIRQFLIG